MHMLILAEYLTDFVLLNAFVCYIAALHMYR